MLPLWIGLALFSGASALVCPPGVEVYKYTYGGDCSCYSEVEPFFDKNNAYSSCAQSNAYLPIIINAFQNTEIQNKTLGGGGQFGEKLMGMWLGMTCTDNQITSCTWDDGTPFSRNTYHNFEKGYPNVTIGPCVYQDVKTGRWRSQVCSSVVSLSPTIGYIGGFCKYTPTNNVPMCPAWNNKFPEPAEKFPYYFDGFCYELYDSNNTIDAENICTQKCGHVVSIHSEGENSFVRDLLIGASKIEGYIDWALTSGFLGISENATKWSDGTPIDYTNYALLNNCDKPFDPFPTRAPPVCNGPQYLGAKGTVYAPGVPYYPYGQQPNVCEYIQKVDEGLHPTMDVEYVTRSNFQPNISISKFEFYSTEDPNDKPFYSFDGYPYLLPPVVSPTNILRAVYTTIGDPNYTYDWWWMDFSTKR